MASSTRIQLPLHVRHDWINLVVAKLAGADFEVCVLSDNMLLRSKGRGLEVQYIPRSYNPDLPASEDNPWYTRPVDRSSDSMGVEQCDPSDLAFGRMKFKDLCGNIHSWFFHQESDDEAHKLLHPGTHGLAVAIGKVVVDVFGGNIVFDDQNEKDGPDYQVSNRKALLPRRTKDQTSNDRYYQFENVLANLSPVSSHDLRRAIEKHGAGRYDMELLVALESTEKKRDLEEVASQVRSDMTPGGDTAARRPKPKI